LSIYPRALPTESDRCFNVDAVRVLVRDNGKGGNVAVLFVQTPGKVDLIVVAQALAEANFSGWQIRHAPNPKSRFFFSQIIERSGDAQISHPINGSRELVADPTVFSQVNRSAAALMVSQVLENLPERGNLLDLYGGYGAFALAHVMSHGGRATVVESSILAVKAGQSFADAHNLPVQFIGSDLAKAGLPVENLDDFDAAILDPPRNGAHPEIISKLNARGPKRLLYLSCHPATLARDLKQLKSYRSLSFVPIDLFPQTPDLEALAILDRN
jgi:tRNA/tmRNA/rRNA uracil-C5-methylase (TrmA/RlmC/RlmD family)